MSMTLTSKHLGSLFLAIMTYVICDVALHWSFGMHLADWSHPIPFLFQIIWWYTFFLSLFLIDWRHLWSDMSPSPMPPIGHMVGWVLAIVFFSGFFIYSGRYFHMDLPFEWPMILNYHTGSFFIFCFLLLVVSPIVQEVLFRGWLWGHLARSPIGSMGALAITTYLWAIPSSTPQIYSGVFNLLMGLLLGMARSWTGGVLTPILMHIGFCSFELFMVSKFMWQG